MKKIVLHSFCICWAVVFLLAGSGFNIHRFCCPGCKTQQTETLHTTTACCAEPAEDNMHDCTELDAEAPLCTHCPNHDEDNACGVERYYIAQNTIVTEPATVPAAEMASATILYHTINLIPVSSPALYACHYVPPDNPDGRTILLQSAILRI
ncbi:MAG: hypothetical protein LBS16_02930 [Prevotellaceae bacterium]|jgi:hypothetical protein|nr:hypothetical protein [Prevotellaceae bacterium]